MCQLVTPRYSQPFFACASALRFPVRGADDSVARAGQQPSGSFTAWGSAAGKGGGSGELATQAVPEGRTGRSG